MGILPDGAMASEKIPSQKERVQGVEVAPPPPVTLLVGILLDGETAVAHSGVGDSPIASVIIKGGNAVTLAEPDKTDGRQKCDASRFRLTGCSRLFLSRLGCREADRDRYC